MSHLRQLYHGRHAASNLEDVSKIVFMPHFSPSVRTGQHGSTWVNMGQLGCSIWVMFGRSR